jgi:signal transduction histidine kinase/ligand-binding sensor domain-containing protein
MFTLFVCILLAAPARAADKPRFDSWDTKDGLPQNSVQSIVRTSDGYIWLTTLDGLVRFDGVRFKIFKKGDTPELRTNRLLLVMVDNGDRLWILTEDLKSVIKYESGRFKSFTAGADFESDNMREPFVEAGSMHFRSGGFTYVYEAGKFHKQAQPACPKLKVWFSRNDNELIVNGKPFHVEDSDKSTPSFTRKQTVESEQRDRAAISSVELPSGIWFLCPSGQARFICRFSNSELSVTGSILTYRAHLERDGSGNLWFTDEDGTLGRIPPEAQSSLAFGIDMSDFEPEVADPARAQNLIMYRDPEEHLWLGTSKGLRFLKTAPLVTVLSRRSGLPAENIYALAEAPDGAIWFGDWGSHLVRYFNGKFDLFEQGIVTSLKVDKDGRIWSGSSNGAQYFEDGKWTNERKVSELTFAISTIDQDRSGAMWFGSKRGIVKLTDGRTAVFEVENGMPGNDVTAFLETRSGDIWVGTSSGLARIREGVIQAFTEKDGLPSGFVRALYEDDDGVLWIGTYDSGLIRYEDGRFTNIRSKDGLFGDGVFCILEDEDWLWISNNQGIYRVRREELNSFANGEISSVFSASYGPEDGLVNVEANGGKQPAGIKSKDGRLWFATAGGVAIIDPKGAYGEQPPPKVRIEEVTIDTRPPAEMGDEIVVRPGQSNLEINYTAFDYENARRIQFRYRLEGLDEDWTIAKDRRTAYFSHLPYGEYVLRVVAANRNGVWDDKGATIRIRVLHPFYRTNWFYSLLIFFAVGIFAAVYVIRVRQLNARHAERADFTRRLIETQESERQRIALELHDSIGQSLVVIRNRALMGLRKTEDPAGVLDQMQEISDASAAALQETREIAHNLHPYQIKHLGLAMALVSLVEDVGSSSGISFVTEVEDAGGPFPEETAINIYRIAQECLNNIVRHSGAGKVSFGFRSVNGNLILTIQDDGKGFDPAAGSKGLGLKSMTERAEIIGGSVSVLGVPGKGTKVRLVVPVGRASDAK